MARRGRNKRLKMVPRTNWRPSVEDNDNIEGLDVNAENHDITTPPSEVPIVNPSTADSNICSEVPIANPPIVDSAIQRNGE
ncbi:hypothetical protein CCACVL1_25684 [Corchorus capsularis]|uniref:Uncharacterized protein n=1 Tax=Corchorus capsularis TaxID=210143 RepID=A0A1R3GIC4_COCAP|nr:hypothetical protein CCACVL1_25684 [Corchorus capsularis]